MFDDLEESLDTKVKAKEKVMDSVTVQGDIYWAFLHEKNDMSGKYQFDLCNLSTQAVEALESMGLTVKSQPDKKPQQGSFITIKSKSFPLTLFDKDGKPISPEIKVGNGSKARVKVGFYDTKTPMGQNYRGPKLLGSRVVELIEFVAGENMPGSMDVDEEVL